MIFTTAYTSTMRRPMTDAELVELLVVSRNRNAERGVTGLLLYRAGRVLQMLEGEESVVRSLYDRILMDTRHEHVSNVWTSTAAERRFPAWTMGFEDLDGVQRSMSTGDALTPPWSAGVVAAAGGREKAAEVAAALAVSADQEDYLSRRAAVLRRSLVSGDRLVGALAIILNGHDPEEVGATAQRRYVRCRVCQAGNAPELDAYPCATAKNALWALEAAGPR